MTAYTFLLFFIHKMLNMISKQKKTSIYKILLLLNDMTMIMILGMVMQW